MYIITTVIKSVLGKFRSEPIADTLMWFLNTVSMHNLENDSHDIGVDTQLEIEEEKRGGKGEKFRQLELIWVCVCEPLDVGHCIHNPPW